MDKLIETEGGATITNDGATVLNLLQVQHPAAALLVDVAQSQDLEVQILTKSEMAVLLQDLDFREYRVLRVLRNICPI